MQTPKARSGTSEMVQRTSPATPRAARQPKTAGSETDSASSTHSSIRTSMDRSPKVLERRSPRSPVTEKKRPGRVTELESKVAQLEEELKKAKDQLGSSDSCKMRALQEADEAKKQFLAMAMKVEDSQRELVEQSAAEEARLQELRKLSQERDKAWQSELEALQQQHAVDSATLASTMNENQRLKVQLENAFESESEQAKQTERAYAELQSMKVDMTEALSVIENLKAQLQDYKESEAQAQAMVLETSQQLEMTKTTVAMLSSDGLKAMELLSSATGKLEESRAEVSSLEEAVNKLQNDLIDVTSKACSDFEHDEISQSTAESDQLKLELTSLKTEIEQLRSALKATETKCQEEQTRSMMHIQSADELAKHVYESNIRETELEAEIKKTKAEVEELKANLMDKETELQSISAENEGLNLEIEKFQLNQTRSGLEMELDKAKAVVLDLKANLMDKETELQSISEENELLKAEMEKREMERGKGNAEVMAEVEAARAAERAVLMKLGYVTEEADKSGRRAAKVAEQLEAAQAANLEMEAELKRLKVQSDQWRKAAEAAAAIVSAGGNNNGKLLERSGSLDAEYHPISRKMLSSPYSEDMDDDDSPKKKNNMLKKIGVLWKKGQK